MPGEDIRPPRQSSAITSADGDRIGDSARRKVSALLGRVQGSLTGLVGQAPVAAKPAVRMHLGAGDIGVLSMPRSNSIRWCPEPGPIWAVSHSSAAREARSFRCGPKAACRDRRKSKQNQWHHSRQTARHPRAVRIPESAKPRKATQNQRDRNSVLNRRSPQVRRETGEREPISASRGGRQSTGHP